MKRRNVEGSTGKLRRAAKRAKLNDGNSSFNALANLKFLLVWLLIIILDFITEFRFELLYPFWIFFHNISDRFKYNGILNLFYYIFMAITLDMFCYYLLPIQWIFFLSSSYVWLKYIWYTDRGLSHLTILISLFIIYVEAFIRLRELKSLIHQSEISRSFSAHGIGYPIFQFCLTCKSYISYRIRLHKKYIVAKENDFYYQLLKDALVKPSTVVTDSTNDENTQTVDNNKLTVSATTNTALITNQLSTIVSNSSHKYENNSFNAPFSFISLFLKLNPISFAQSIGTNYKKLSILNDPLKTAIKTETNNGCVITKENDCKMPFIPLRARWFNLFFNNNIYDLKNNCYYSTIGSGASIKNGLMQFIIILFSILFFCPKVLICFMKKLTRLNKNKNDIAVDNLEDQYKELIETDTTITTTSNNTTNNNDDDHIDNLPKIIKTDIDSEFIVSDNNRQLNNFICMFCGKMQNCEIDLQFPMNDELSINDADERKSTIKDKIDIGIINSVESKIAVSNQKIAVNATGGLSGVLQTGKEKKKNRNSNNRQNLANNNSFDPIEHIKLKDDQIWKLESDNSKLKSELQTIRQCESDLQKQLKSYINEEQKLKTELVKQKSEISSLQNKISGMMANKNQVVQNMHKLERQLDDEKKKLRCQMEQQVSVEKRVKQAEENAARANALAASTRNTCPETCRNKQREYEMEFEKLRNDLKNKEEQLRIKEMNMKSNDDIYQLLSTINMMREKNENLAELVKRETVMNSKLKNSLEDARRQLQTQRIIFMEYEKEINELRRKYNENSYKFGQMMTGVGANLSGVNLGSVGSLNSGTPGLIVNLNEFSSSSSPSTASDIDLVNRCFSSYSPNSAASPASLPPNTPPLSVASVIGGPSISDSNHVSMCNILPASVKQTMNHNLSCGSVLYPNNIHNSTNSNTNLSNATNINEFVPFSDFSIDPVMSSFNWNLLNKSISTKQTEFLNNNNHDADISKQSNCNNNKSSLASLGDNLRNYSTANHITGANFETKFKNNVDENLFKNQF